MHGRTIAFGLVDLDDRDLLVDDHAFLVAAGSLWRVFGRSYLGVVDAGHAYYRPLVAASYALDARWSGLDPRGYHVTNVVVFCAAAALLCGLLRALRLGPGIALTGALAFSVHPALASAVAWIPGRNDALAAAFTLAAWLAFAIDLERPSIRWRVLHVASFAAALFTKETALVLPLVLAAHAVLVRPERARAARLPVSPLYPAAWTALVAARLLAHPMGGALAPPGPRAALTLLVSSLGQITLPFDPHAIAVEADLPLWPGALAGAALCAAAFRVPGVRRGVVGLGGAAFLLFLVPVLAVGGTLVLACRLVLPACGALIAIGEIARATQASARTVTAAAAAVLLGLASITAGSEGAFADARAFAVAAVDGSPHCPLAHVCLGRSYQASGDDDRALAEYDAALALGPAEVVHNNIAVIDMKNGRWSDADRELASELALNPRYGRAYFNRAIVLRHEGRPGEACEAVARAIALAPGGADDDLRAERERDCAR